MSDLEMLKQQACDQVDAVADRLIAVSRAIHAQPELAFQEHRACAMLAGIAEEAGMAVERRAYGLDTAFAAEFGNAGGPAIAVLSEYDALPGIGHGCGHNIIAAIGLGAALALKAMPAALPGRVRYIGTPAEERGCGKEIMARNGAFDGLDAAMMVHPAWVNAKAFRTLCLGEVHVEYVGQSGHAALAPEQARNALDAVVMSYQAIANLRQHLKRGEHVHGVITDGGDVPNVFTVSTKAHYFARAATIEDLAALKRRVEACLQAGATATGCEARIAWSDADYQPMKVNLPLADAFETNAGRLGRDFTDYLQLPVGGADMGNVSQRVPVLHALIAAAPAEVIIHTPEFTRWAGSERGDQAVIDGAKALAMTAIDMLADGAFRTRVAAAQATL